MSDTNEPVPLDPAKLVFATLSDPGRVRPENQDAAALLSNVSNERLAVVADGMGGHRGGETASKLCIDTLGRIFRDPHGTPEERLRRGLELANEEVYSAALSNADLKGMGTTAVALLFGPGTRGVWLAWVGDSRCYRLRDGALEPLTRDHSLMAEWIEIGVISPADVESHPRRHELTRAIGQAPDVAVEVVRVDLRAGDRFLLCSDGIHAPLPERALKAALGGHPPEESVRLLVERANANGGPDNATALVVDVPAEAISADAVEPPPELALELELPTPPPKPAPEPPAPPPPPAAEPAPASDSFSLDLETTAHSSAAIDAALAELAAARSAPPLAAAPEPSAPELSLMFETNAAPEPAPASSAAPAAAPAPGAAPASIPEDSFADLLGDDAPEEPLAAAPPRSPAAAPLEFGAPLRGSADPQSPSLVAPAPPQPIRIPLMTPVRARRSLHAPSLLAGLGLGALVAALAAGGWIYTEVRRPEPALPARAAAPPARRAVEPAPAPAPEEVRARAPAPAIAPVPAPAPEPARAATPPAPAAALAPAPAPAPVPQAAPASRPPAPIPVPDAPKQTPTTVVIVRPGATPPGPAAPAPAAASPAALPSAQGFELSPPVRRFVDDWLRAQATHDAALFSSLGFRELPSELAGTWTTRDSYKLLAASVDEERSSPDLVYLRLVVSYAFRDATGRFRTQDEERMILRSTGAGLRFEGRWQQ